MTAHLRDIFQWMVSTLEGDSEMQSLGLTGVFMYKAPEDYSFPYIILEKQSAVHTFVLGKQAYNRHWIAVKAVSTGTDGGDLARQIQDRARELLNLQRPSLTEGYTILVKASTDFEYVEAEAGNYQFFNVGTVYVVQLSG